MYVESVRLARGALEGADALEGAVENPREKCSWIVATWISDRNNFTSGYREIDLNDHEQTYDKRRRKHFVLTVEI